MSKPNNYKISKENGMWAVSEKKTGLIIADYQHKPQAEEYRNRQMLADEQSMVMSEFNGQQLAKELAAEFSEFF
jgi:hypothetical protein